MSNFLSNRQRELKIGIVSYTENNTVLQVTGNANVTGIVTASGGFNLGISSAGTTITSGPVTRLNFIGAGNTFAVNGTTVDISIAGNVGVAATVSISTIAPSSPKTGSLWFNPNAGRTFVYYDENSIGVGSTAAWIDASPSNASGGGGGSSTVSIGATAPGAPDSGDLWYSTEYGRIFVWYDEVTLGVGSTAVWVDAAPFNAPEDTPTLTPAKTENTIVATEGQTVFSVSYTAGYIDVFLNGVRLSASEFIATNGTTVTLASGASAGDVLDVVEYTMGIGATGPQGPAAQLTIGTRSGVLVQNISGIGFTVSLRSGIGTVNI